MPELFLPVKSYRTNNRYPKGHIDDSKHLPYINKLKNGKYPKSPSTVKDVLAAFEENVNEPFFGKYHKKTVVGEGFAFSIFCSEIMLHRIERTITDERVLLTDATFRAVPIGPFKQLLIIYIAYDSTVINVVYRIIHHLDSYFVF